MQGCPLRRLPEGAFRRFSIADQDIDSLICVQESVSVEGDAEADR
jgi:hypothetical protein